MVVVQNLRARRSCQELLCRVAALLCVQADKARSWFRRAVLLDPDVGDFWALLYNCEMQQKPPTAEAVIAKEQTVADVMKQCVAAQPRHGERWQRVAKANQNAHAKTETLLKLVAADLLDEPPP